MPPSEEIFRMIESVSPEDTARLDEISARVWCYLKGKEYVKNDRRLGGIMVIYGTDKDFECPIPNYCFSRDALKAIRIEGYDWRTFNYASDKKPFCVVCAHQAGNSFQSPALPTEELAELHAIIQCIAHDRATDQGREG